MLEYLDKHPTKLDWFPIVKAHIMRQPVKCHDTLAYAVQVELSNKDIGSMPYHEKMMIESDLHELIDYLMEKYYFHKEDK
jgi:hypothetical protein